MEEENQEEQEEGELQKIIRAVEDKTNALHSHNLVRTLHALELLDWDDTLAEGASKWALHLAHTDCGLSHSSPLTTYGENIYISKGGLEPSRSHHAVLLWYKGIEHFDFHSPGFNLASGSFSQLIWKDTKHVGVGIAFREDTRKTYIVAQYSPPGNTCYSGSYDENVSQPVAGMPARIPRIDDLIAAQPMQRYNNPVDVPYGWARGLFRTMCKWCNFSGPKLVESWSGCPTLPEKCNSKTKQNDSKTCEKDTECDKKGNNIPPCDEDVTKCDTEDTPKCDTEDTPKCDTEVTPKCDTEDTPKCDTEDTPKCDTEVAPNCDSEDAPNQKRVIHLTADTETICEIASASSVQLDEVEDDKVEANPVPTVEESEMRRTEEHTNICLKF